MPTAIADNHPTNRYRQVHAGILLALDNAARAAGRPTRVRLLAVSRTRNTPEIAELAACGQAAIGDNNVREAIARQATQADPTPG